MILYVALSIFLVWSVYNGDIYPREGCILAAIFVALNAIYFFFKLPPPIYIVTFVSLLICLIVKAYAGDVKIR